MADSDYDTQRKMNKKKTHRLSQSFYYFQLFNKNKLKIRSLMNILSDRRSQDTVCALLFAKISLKRDRYYYYKKIAPCDHIQFTHKLEDNYCVYEAENPYFLSDIFSLTSEMVFLDGGGYIGDTFLCLKEVLGGECKYVYAFEPEYDNYIKMERNAKKYGDHISCYNSGLYDYDGRVSFSSNDAASKIEDCGSSEVSVINAKRFLDELSDNKPTFIKLDIEGSEMKVIQSMGEYIRNNMPDLAISIYHNLEDLWEIPLAIHNLNPAYSCYIRHQSNCFTETVFYATKNTSDIRQGSHKQ